jgi:hypothetical protein
MAVQRQILSRLGQQQHDSHDPCYEMEEYEMEEKAYEGTAVTASPTQQNANLPSPVHDKKAVVLPAAPDVFEIEHGLNVESAWYGWHGAWPGGGPCHPWKSINPQSTCISSTDKRRDILQQLSKIKCLVAFVQGSTADTEVERDVSHAWEVCKESAMEALKAQGITEWPLYGSIRTAYMALLKLRKSQQKIIDNMTTRVVDTTSKKPACFQQTITAYFDKSGKLMDMSDTTNVAERIDYDTGETNYFQNHTDDDENAHDLVATSSCAAEDCLICPHCPESGGAKGRELVVYRDSNALWQHWVSHHMGDQRPALWEIQRVQGTKLLPARSSPWTKVEHARSFHVQDYQMKKMRKDIQSGSRRLENGTFVELQPDKSATAAGKQWFAVVRDGRVLDGKITVQYCADNCQTRTEGSNQRVWVESILRVGMRAHEPFTDVPVSSRSLRASKHDATTCSPCKQPTSTTPRLGKRPNEKEPATSASCTPRKQPSSTTTSPGKRTKQNELETPYVKEANLGEMRQAAGVDDTKIQKGPFHCKITQDIVTRIIQATKNDAESLKKFRDANDLLEQAGWSRCRTTEQGFPYVNITHPSYLVKQMPRDGKCMYHCMLRILKEEGVVGAPSDAAALRKALATFVDDQDPPKGCDKGDYPFGGIHNDGDYLPLEESIKNNYGGEAALAVFVQLYGITVHCIAPESNRSEVTHKGDGKNAKQYRMLQTLSWNTWAEVKTFHEKEKVTTTSYKRKYSGDHWQLLQPAAEEQPLVASAGWMQSGSKKGASMKLEFERLPASGASAAATAPKQVDAKKIQKLAPMRLAFNDAECFSDSSNAQIMHRAVPMSAAANEQRQAKKTLVIGDSERQSFVGSTVCALAVPQSPRLTRSLRSVELHTEFMLRATESNCLCCHKDWRREPCYPGLYKEWRISNQAFLDIDYGMRFGLVYPRHVHLILEMYPVLDESNRCFFMTLGIATGLDPFHLQCAFRQHVKKLQSTKMSLKSPNLRNLALVLAEGLDENQPVDSALLSFCWPPALERFQITVISCRRMKHRGSPYTLTIFDPTPAVKKKSIILKVENGHYTILQQLVSSTVELSRLFSPENVNRPPFLHIECPTLQMPDIEKYQVFSCSTAYLAGALPGTIPGLGDRIRIWKALKHLIPDDFRNKENSGSTTKTTQHEHTGSLQWDSWDLIRRALISGMEASVSTDKPGSAGYTRSRQPKFCGASNTTSDSHSDCCFLDIGSEIGRGLYAMLGDPNISHIAGIEIQPEMFALSVSIFKGVRSFCLQEGFRMPQVTLLNSCMLKRCPELDLLYSFADIIFINNFVFDRDIYFSETKDATSDRHVSKQFDKTSRFLSANLAARLRTALRDSSCLAVFVPQSFHSDFAVHSKVSVGVTWGQPSSVHTVHILKNYHRIQIHNELHLICANHSEVSRYEKLLKAYCEGLSNVLATALHYEPRGALDERLIDGRLIIDDDTENQQNFEQDWPQDIPRIASFVPDTFMRLEDLVCIQHTAWFNSELIDNFKYALQKSFPDVYILKDLDQVGCLQEFIHNKNYKSKLQSITKASVVVFIFNLDNVHWIAARICKHTASVCVMDSFQNANDNVIQSLQDLARKCWNIILRPLRTNVPHQDNSCDCGPLACLFALFLAQTAVNTNPNPVALTYNSKSTAREMRIRILADLYAGCITKLQPSAQ